MVDDIEQKQNMRELIAQLWNAFADFMEGLAYEVLGAILDYYIGVIAFAIVSAPLLIWKFWKNWKSWQTRSKDLKRYAGSYIGYRTGGVKENSNPHILKIRVIPDERKIKVIPHRGNNASLYMHVPNRAAEVKYKLERVPGGELLKFVSCPHPHLEDYVGQMILYTNALQDADAEFLYGVYSFTNLEHTPVAGNVLFVREGVDPTPYRNQVKLKHVEAKKLKPPEWLQNRL